MAESIGVPLPGETILISAGVLIQRGSLNLGDAIIFGILGAVVGDQIGYWVGRKGGRPFILRYGRYVLITPQRLARAEEFFAYHGGKAVFMARFFSGLRVFGALVAGTSRMRWTIFLFYNALGGAVWVTAVVLAGYFLGSSLGVVERWTGQASVLLLALTAVALILYLAYRWISRHPNQARRAFDRLGGRHVRASLESPMGLWLERRLSPHSAYGLTLTLGLAAIILFSWALSGVVQAVVDGGRFVRPDLAALRFFHSNGEPYLTTAVNVFEAVFSPSFLLSACGLAGLVFLILAQRRNDFETALSGAVLLATVFGTLVLTRLFEVLIHRPRPPSSLQLVHDTGYGFPSQHAVTVVAVGAAFWYLFGLRPLERWVGSWRGRARIGLSVVMLALLVGFGRVFTGAHYPSDVLAGWGLGGLWASVCLTAAEVFRRLHARTTKNEELEIQTKG